MRPEMGRGSQIRVKILAERKKEKSTYFKKVTIGKSVADLV